MSGTLPVWKRRDDLCYFNSITYIISLFDTFFNDPFFEESWAGYPYYPEREAKKPEKKAYGHTSKSLMKTDIKEDENGYELMMDLPGYEKNEIAIKLDKGYLTVTATKETESKKESQDGEKKEASGEKAVDEKTAEKPAQKPSFKYICKERFSGSCQRTFYVGEEVEQEDIKAAFKNGVLVLSIPKPEKKEKPETDKYIAIE